MTLQSPMLALPGTYVGIVRDAALDSGILGQLAPEKPTIFGPVKGATFTGVPRASIVGESDPKPSQDPYGITRWQADPIKLVVQVRVSDEFRWGDSDYQLGIMQDLVAPTFGTAIGRAVDLITFHGINPATGTVSPKAVKHLDQATKTVEVNGAPTAELLQGVGLVASTGTLPNGIAMDSQYNYALTTEVYPAGHSLAGQPMYPQMGFGGAQSWRGIEIRNSTTVSGMPEMADTKIRAIMGDFGQVRWGFQRNFPLEMIEYGDPDNAGRDLKGHNEVLLRSEAVIYVAIGDLNKFALVKDAA